MLNILKTIENNNLIKKGEKIGVAVSGGIDSMCLLHFLNAHKKELNIELMVINIDHQIRKTSKDDTNFVKNYCKENNINFKSFNVDAVNLSQNKKLTLEEGARIARYQVFESLLNKKIVDKIALAHHTQDQVETFLLNLLRGTGLKGATGMEYIRDGFIRPMLDTTKAEILAYANENNISYVQDETNFDSTYSRNFLRNEIIPLIKTKWQNFESNIINFTKICKADDEYILSNINFDDLVYDENLVKIPLSYFIYNKSIINRIIRHALEYLKATKDFETKHYSVITNLVNDSENGSKINLPNNIIASKEYDYLTLSKKKEKKQICEKKFKIGTENYNNVEFVIKKCKTTSNLKQERTHYIDYDKLPKNCVWRTKQDGDIFTKFGGGTKKLKDYFIDKKIPQRLRNEIPLLCDDNKVLIILGVEISDSLKIDNNTKQVLSIKF